MKLQTEKCKSLYNASHKHMHLLMSQHDVSKRALI